MMLMLRMMIANDQAGEKKRGETCLGWARGYRRRRGIVTEWDFPQTDTRRYYYHDATTTRPRPRLPPPAHPPLPLEC